MQRVLIDQLIRKYIITSDRQFEQYLQLANPGEHSLNQMISANPYYLDDYETEASFRTDDAPIRFPGEKPRRKDESNQLSRVSTDTSLTPIVRGLELLNTRASVWGIDKMWIIFAQKLKNYFRHLEQQTCREEIYVNRLGLIRQRIDLCFAPLIMDLWKRLESNPLRLDILFPHIDVSRIRKKGPKDNCYIKWLKQSPSVPYSAQSLFQAALLNVETEDVGHKFSGLITSIRWTWREINQKLDADLPFDPLDIIPTSCLFGSCDMHTFESGKRILNVKVPKPKGTASTNEVDALLVLMGLMVESTSKELELLDDQWSSKFCHLAELVSEVGIADLLSYDMNSTHHQTSAGGSARRKRSVRTG